MGTNTRLKVWVWMLCFILVGCAAGCDPVSTTGYVPPLEISGDVSNPLTIKDLSDMDWTEFQIDEKKYQGISLQEAVSFVEPWSEDFTVILTASDGLAAEIDGSTSDSSYLVFSAENGWEAVHLNHPPSAAVKHLERIVVVSQTDDWGKTVNIIRTDKNIRQLTPGQLFAAGLQHIPIFEGTSAQEVEGRSYAVSIYTRRLGVPVDSFIEINESEHFLVVGRNGEVAEGAKDAFLQWRGNELRYVSADGRTTVEHIAGILLNPPPRAVTELNPLVTAALDNEEKVLVIYLDGFGYHQYQYAQEQSAMPFVSSLPEAEMALTAFHPVTNAAMAAMLTGQWPPGSGVHSRAEREMAVPTFFAHALETEKQAVLLEGNIGILKTEIEPTLHLDNDQSGDADDEIFAAARERLDDNLDLLMVHFHSIDDSGHDHGDRNPSVLETMKRNDRYVQALVENWSGTVFIVSDHGMHQEGDGGSHGVFRYEDMFVPLIVTEGGGLL